MSQNDLKEEHFNTSINKFVSYDETCQAVSTLLKWAGDDPSREGLLETPRRVAKAFREYFAGYEQDPYKVLQKTFSEVEGYDEMVVLKNIEFQSHCEHHLAPFFGVVHIAYIPSERVVGISKLARVVDIFSKRLQIQEKMTSQIADAIHDVLKPKGVAVVVEAQHMCMTARGVKKHDAVMKTSRLIGLFKQKLETRKEFLSMIER